MARQFVKNVASKRVRQAFIAHVLNHDLSSITRLPLEQEVLQQMDEPDVELICSYCKRNGRRRRDCTTRKKAIRESNSLSNDPFAHCTKCDAIGHSAYIYRVTPQVQIEQQRQNQNANRTAGNSSSNNSNQNRGQNNRQNRSGQNYGQNDRNDLEFDRMRYRRTGCAAAAHGILHVAAAYPK